MDEHATRHRLTTFYIFSLGVWTLLPPMVMWIAMEDILIGTLWPTTVVLISYSVPDIITKVLSPSIVSRISFRSSFGLLTLLLVGSIVLLVIVDDVKVRIVGVAVLGIAYGFTTITCVRMLAYYEQAEVLANAFQNGTNASVLLASFGYTGLTTWLCVAPRIVIAACIPVCLVPLVFYVLLDKEPLKDHLRKTTDHHPVQYTSLAEQCSDEYTTTPLNKLMPKLVFLVKVFPLIGYTYVTNFCTHFIMTAVLPTLTFPSSPFRPRDHFQYYRFINDAGIMLGGIVSLLFSCLGYKWIEFFRIRKFWILALLNIIHLLFFVFASWYRFLPNVILVLVLCFTQGIVHGLTLVHCAANTANVFSCASDTGTALGLIEVALSVGRISAGLLGIFTERDLREHCTYRLMLGRFCLARQSSRAEWNTNLSCKI